MVTQTVAEAMGKAIEAKLISGFDPQRPQAPPGFPE